MKASKDSIAIAAGVALLAGLVLGLVILPTVLRGSSSDIVPRQPATASPQPYPGMYVPEPYPGPPYPAVTYSPIEWPPQPTETAEPPPEPTPMPGPLYPEAPPFPAGRAATLFKGDVWLVGGQQPPEALTDFGDVAAIFGWNRNGSLLLFGRGKTTHPDRGDTTELWMLDTATRQARQLTITALVRTAAWSPVDDRLAYCELGNVLTVITLDGEVLQHLERVLCTINWSPDGKAIAVSTYTPDMLDSDGLAYTVIGVFWLVDSRLQVFSDAKDESQMWAVWSIDEKYVLFTSVSYNESEKNHKGWFIVDLSKGQINQIFSLSIGMEEIGRSPRADYVAFRIGSDVYVMDFTGKYDIVGQGNSLHWLLDGTSLLYRDLEGNFQIFTIDARVGNTLIGGSKPSPGINWPPEYFFRPEE